MLSVSRISKASCLKFLSKKPLRRFRILFGFGLLGLGSGSLGAEHSDFTNLRHLALEDLVDLRITTVSHRPERLMEVPAAITLIDAETLRRTGATTLADALRLVPGMHVARVDNNTWAVSARGFNAPVANKMEVLIDGRSIYSPLFSGVYWDVQNPMMEDVDRIEVIRGSAGTLWGPNAMNGAVHLFSKHAGETQGMLVSGGGGIGETAFASVRQGGKIGNHTWYRIYGRSSARDDIDLRLHDVESTAERSLFSQSGFRLDSEPSPDDHWTLQGDLYEGRFDQRGALDRITARGANIGGRWTRTISDRSEIMFHAYYDRTERAIPGSFDETRNSGQIDLRHRFPLGERQEVIWGADYRVSKDKIAREGAVLFSPDSRTVQSASLFVEDRIIIVPRRVILTFGTRIGHDAYTGFEHQPNARLAWTPNRGQTFWLSAGRTVRTPSRVDTDLVAIEVVGIVGDSDFQAEVLWGYEAGYRVQFSRNLSLDAALYFNDYDRLRSHERPLSGEGRIYGNLLQGETWGGELSVSFRATEWWRLQAGYANLQKDLKLRPESTDQSVGQAEGNDPKHTAFLHSSIDLGRSWTLDAVLRYVSKLPSPRVPSYTELDLRLGWRVTPEMEFSIVGQNLLHSEHREFGVTHTVPRTLFAKIKWEF